MPLLWADRLHRHATSLDPPRQRQVPLRGVKTAYQHLKNVGWARRRSDDSPELDAGLEAVPDRS